MALHIIWYRWTVSEWVYIIIPNKSDYFSWNVKCTNYFEFQIYLFSHALPKSHLRVLFMIRFLLGVKKMAHLWTKNDYLAIVDYSWQQNLYSSISLSTRSHVRFEKWGPWFFALETLLFQGRKHLKHWIIVCFYRGIYTWTENKKW